MPHLARRQGGNPRAVVIHRERAGIRGLPAVQAAAGRQNARRVFSGSMRNPVVCQQAVAAGQTAVC